MSGKKKLRPNFDPLSTIKHNLNVLRRRDPFIKRIIHTAAQVSLYDLNVETTVWSRMNVEGPLFVVQRDAEPQFQFIVMNRLSPDYLVEHLVDDFEFELHNPYILYRNASQEVNGIWFYYSDDCDAVAKLFNNMLDKDTKASMEEKVPSDKSKFEELLKRLSNLTESPGESFSADPPPADTKLPAFVHSSITSKVTGNYAEDAKNIRQPCLSAPAVQMPSVSYVPSSTPAFLPVYSDTMNSGNQFTDLGKPLHLFPAAAPSSLLVPPVPPFVTSSAALPHSPRPPRLFPPPTPFLPVSPISGSTLNRPVISREKVRDALLSLTKDDQFIDKIFQALEKP